MNGGGVRTCETLADRGVLGAIKEIEHPQHLLLPAHLCDLPTYRGRGCVFSVKADGNEREDDRGPLQPHHAGQERRQDSHGAARMGKG